MAGELGLVDVSYKNAKKRASGNVVIECILNGKLQSDIMPIDESIKIW